MSPFPYTCSTFHSLDTTASSSPTLPPTRTTQQKATSASAAFGAATAASAFPPQGPTASGMGASDSASGAAFTASAAVSISSAAPPPFPSLPVTCGVSPPAETLLLRDLQMLQLQRMLRTVGVNGAKVGQQQQQHHGPKAGQQQQHQQHTMKAGHQQYGGGERSLAQQDVSWLKNFSGWVVLQLSPSSAALARALTTVKGHHQQFTGDSAAAGSSAKEKKGAMLRSNTVVREMRKKQRDVVSGDCARVRAASVLTRPAGKAGATTANSKGGRSTIAAKRNAEVMRGRKPACSIQHTHQLQAAGCEDGDRDGNDDVTCQQQRRKGNNSGCMTWAATTAVDPSQSVKGVVTLPKENACTDDVPGQRRSSGRHRVDNTTLKSSSSSDMKTSRSVSTSRSISSSNTRYSSNSLATTKTAACGREKSNNRHLDKTAEQALSMLEAEVYMSRQTLLQTSGPRLSGFTDCSGKGVRVQRHLIEQILASAAPRFVFEQFHAQGIQPEPSLARYLEKRRIQNTLRRLKEHIAMVEEAATKTCTDTNKDFSRTFLELARAAITHCPSHCSIAQDEGKEKTSGDAGRRKSSRTSSSNERSCLDAGRREELAAARCNTESKRNSGRASVAAAVGSASFLFSSRPSVIQLLPMLHIQQEAVGTALEALNWWAPGLNEQDKKEIFFAIAVAATQPQPVLQHGENKEEQEEKDLPLAINERGWRRVFEVVPFNLPDWPVPSSAFPAQSETLRPLLPFLAAPSSNLPNGSSRSNNSRSNSSTSNSSSRRNSVRDMEIRTAKRRSSTASLALDSAAAAGVDSFCSEATNNSLVSVSSGGCTGAQVAPRHDIPPATSTAPQCSRFFVLNKPQYILTAAPSTQPKTDTSCCRIFQGEFTSTRDLRGCLAEETRPGVSTAGALDSATTAEEMNTTTRRETAPGEGSLEVGNSLCGKVRGCPHVAPSAKKAVTALDRTTEANCSLNVTEDRDFSGSREYYVMLQGKDKHEQPASGVTQISASSSAEPRCYCSFLSVPCLCGVLHLCRVALLICESLCQPVCSRFPNLLWHLTTLDEPSVSARIVGNSCDSSAKKGQSQKNNVAQCHGAHAAHVSPRSSSDATTAASHPKQGQHCVPGDNSAAKLLSQEAAAGEQEKCSGATGDDKVRNNVFDTKDDSCYLQQTQMNASSKNQMIPLPGEREKHAPETQVLADHSCTSSASATTGKTAKVADPLKHLVRTWNPVHPAGQSEAFSLSSVSTSSLSISPLSLSSSAAKQSDTNADQGLIKAVSPSLSAVPSPYPPSPPLVSLLTQQQRRYKTQQGPHSAGEDDAMQKRRDMMETKDDQAPEHCMLMSQHTRGYPPKLSSPTPGDTHHRTAGVECQFSQGKQRMLQQQEENHNTSPAAPAQLMIPVWHLEQDFLLSRLVSLEEIQAALGLLLPAAWVLAGLQLIIGAATTALSPAEWISLLHPCSSAASSLEVDKIIHRFNIQHPLRLCSACCNHPELSHLIPARPSTSSSAQDHFSFSTLAPSHVSCLLSLTSGVSSHSTSPGQHSIGGNFQGVVPAVAPLVSRWQRRVEQTCTCYLEKHSFYKLVPEDGAEHQTERKSSVARDYSAIISDPPQESSQVVNLETGTTRVHSEHDRRIPVTAAGSHTAITTKEFVPQPSAKNTSKLSTKQETRKRSGVITSAMCCNSRDVWKARSRSGCSVVSDASQENAWAQRRDSRSRLGLHWWSFLSLDDKNKKRPETREHRHMKKRSTSASRGRSTKEYWPKNGAFSAAQLRSRTCTRRGDTADSVDSQKCPQRSYSLRRDLEMKCNVSEGDSLSEYSSMPHSRHNCKSDGQQLKPCAVCDEGRTRSRTAETRTHDPTAARSRPVPSHEHGSCAETKLATQVSTCIHLVVESLFASDKARKAFEKLSAAALSSSAIELGMPNGGVDALIPLVRTGGSCCFDLYALLACCNLFFRIFEDANVLQVLHDLI